MKFRELAISETFDWINDDPAKLTHNSFFLQCRKTGTRTYQAISTGENYRVGSINVEVFHVESE